MIQAPENIQSLNRYSYVMNNPLNKTDPSGYVWITLATMALKYIATHTTSIMLAKAISLVLTAYQFYSYANLAISVIKVAGGNSAEMAAFAGGLAKSMAKSFAINEAVNMIAGYDINKAYEEKMNTIGSSKTDLPSNKDRYSIIDDPTENEVGMKFKQGRYGLSDTDDTRSLNEIPEESLVDEVKGIFDDIVNEITFGFNAVKNGISQDYEEGGALEAIIGATGGHTDKGFWEQVNDNYASTSIVVGPIKNIDKTLTSVALGGAITRRYGGYSFKDLLLKGTAPHLNSYGSSFRLAAGTTVINSFLITGSYEAGNYIGSILRVTVNHGARSLQ